MSVDTVYERALFEVGPDGKFQRNFDLVYNLFLGSIWSMSYMNIIIALVVTPHHCQLPQKPENLSINDWKLKNMPIENFGSTDFHTKFSTCLLYDNGANNTKSCTAYEYDTTWYKSTVPMEYNWVCDKAIFVANAFAYTRIGEVIGSLIFGWFGDTLGRRFMCQISMSLMIVGRTISVCSGNSFSLFTLGCIVSSFPSWSVVQSISVISLEISSPQRRTLAATFRCVAWTSGVSIMPFIYWWLQDWKLFMVVTTAPLAAFLLLSLNIIESPRWLLLEGKNEDCIRILKRIAKVNGTKLDSSTESDLKCNVSKTKSQSYGPLALFSSWHLGLTTILQLMCCSIILIFPWKSTTFPTLNYLVKATFRRELLSYIIPIYYIFITCIPLLEASINNALKVCVTICYTVLVMRSGEKTDGNPFLEFAWQTAAEMPGNFLGAWLSDKIGRRYCGFTSFSVMTIIFTIITLRSSVLGHIVWVQTWWIGSLLLIICRLFVNVSYYVIGMFNMELYPTCLRQSGMSLGNVFASGAAAVAPYILYLDHRVNSTLPNMILTGSSLFGVISVLLLPETLNVKLPETLEDAQNFRKIKREGTQLKLRKSSKEVVDCAVYISNETN